MEYICLWICLLKKSTRESREEQFWFLLSLVYIFRRIGWPFGRSERAWFGESLPFQAQCTRFPTNDRRRGTSSSSSSPPHHLPSILHGAHGWEKHNLVDPYHPESNGNCPSVAVIRCHKYNLSVFFLHQWHLTKVLVNHLAAPMGGTL